MRTGIRTGIRTGENTVNPPTVPSGGGTLVIDYGFEDFVAYDGNNSPAPGYIFSTSSTTFWSRHINSTHVVQSSCDTPYAGTYYHHTQWCTTVSDPCLGGTATYPNPYNQIGVNGTYPLGTKDTTDLDTAITSDTCLIRFYFRCSDDWTSAQTGIDGGGGLKFVRMYGNGGIGDDSTVLLKMRNDDDSTDPRLGIFDPSTSSTTMYSTGINYQDGDWHSVVFKGTRNNDTNSANNATLSVWIDDWDMVGTPIEQTITCPLLGDAWGFIALGQNWSAMVPPNLMSMDVDKVEVWDGIP